MNYLATEIASVLGRSADEIDRETSLANLGIDSLMTVELKNRIELETVVNIPVMELMNGPTLRKLAEILIAQIEGKTDSVEATTAIQVATDPENQKAGEILDRIDELSEQDIDALLSEMEPEVAE
jgi:acyl carrier protein